MKQILLALLALAFASPAWGLTYYVAQTGGSDSNSCEQAKTHTTAKATVLAGMACMAAGDRLEIKAGSYNTGAMVGNEYPSGTSAINQTVITRFGTDNVTFTCNQAKNCGVFKVVGRSWVTLSYITADTSNSVIADDGGDSIWINGTSSNITFSNLTVVGSGTANGLNGIVAVERATNINIYYSTIHTLGSILSNGVSGAHGIYFEATGGEIAFNTIHNIGGACLKIGENAAVAATAIVRYNLLYGCGKDSTNPSFYAAPAVQLSTRAKDVHFYRNVIHSYSPGAGVEGFCIWLLGTTGGNVFENNSISCTHANARTFRHDTGNIGIAAIFRNNRVAHSGSAGFSLIDAGSPTFSGNRCDAAATGCAASGALGFVSSTDLRLTASAVTDDAIAGGVPCNSICETGAFEVVRNSGAVVLTATPNTLTMVIGLDANIPAILSGTPNVQVRINSGAARNSTSVTLRDNIAVDVVFDGTAPIAGDLIEFKFTDAANNQLCDLALVGGTLNQCLDSFDWRVASNRIDEDPQTPNTEIKVWLRFENNANDSSGNGHNGTCSGTCSYAAGYENQGLTFNGTTTEVSIAHHSDLNLSSALTLSARVKPDIIGTDFQTVLIKNSPGGVVGYYLYTSSASNYCANNGPLFGIRLATTYWNLCGVPLSTTQFTRLTATWDGNTMNLYQDSLLVASRSAPGTISATTGTLQVGASQFGEFFDGLLDEVVVRASVTPPQSRFSAGGKLTMSGAVR